MRTVIYANGSSQHTDRRHLAGIKSFAENAKWDILAVPPIKSKDALSHLMSIWNPAGFLLNCTNGMNAFPLSHFVHTPVVFLGRNDKLEEAERHCIVSDACATTNLAAHELVSLHLKSYAYVTWTKSTYWSNNRREGFKAALALHGLQPEVFDSTRFKDIGPKMTAALAEWLKKLPKPTGVFAASDSIAAAVTDSCHLARLAIPKDVAIVGIGNDEELCESLKPALTSITLDFFAAGQLAAQTLQRMMSGRKAATIEAYPPLCIVRRESTRRFTRPDKIAMNALERIRREACSGLKAIDVVKMFPCSRRAAELRFQAATGNTILGEIRNVRLEKAKILIRGEPLRIDRIANLCGYSSLSSFSNFIRAETGLPPSAWRERG